MQRFPYRSSLVRSAEKFLEDAFTDPKRIHCDGGTQYQTLIGAAMAIVNGMNWEQPHEAQLKNATGSL